MLDSDLADLYGYEVKNLNKQVSRNLEKFPEDFRFQLTTEETIQVLRFQNGTSNSHGGRRYNPYAFTELGIYMLATILRGDIATTQSIYIMRSFKAMKHYLVENQSLLNHADLLKLSNHIIHQDNRISNMEATMATKSDIDKIMDNFIDDSKVKEKIFLDGQVFDAVETYITIYKKAKRNIYMVDDYINVETLSLLKHKQKNVMVTIFTGNKSIDKLTKFEVQKFNEQYPNLYLKYTTKIIDRFLILDYGTDDETYYVCGTSSKDAGQRICTIMQLQNKEIMHTVMEGLLLSKKYMFRL